MSDAYCGIKSVPEGKKRGSMKECAENGKISYYGIKKIDMKLVEAASKKKSKSKYSKNDLIVKIGALNGKIKKITKDLPYEKEKSVRTELEKELKKLEEELKVYKKEYAKLQRLGSRGGSRKGSRSGSRSGSRKSSRKSSRRGSK